VARILGAVSSVTGGKVPVHFKVVVSEEYEKSSRLKRWMRRAPHALIVQVDCAGVATRASSFAWLEQGSTVVCVRLEVANPVAEELVLSLGLAAGHAFWRGTALESTTQFLVAFIWLLSQDEVV
jgi:hypothetical protein